MSYASDISKIQFMLGLLRGKALTWAEARFAGRSFLAFFKEFHRGFAAPVVPFCASTRLFALTQGRRSVEEYVLEFRTLAAEVNWTENSLSASFYHGLKEYIKDELAYREEPAGLEELITLTCCITPDCKPASASAEPLLSLSLHLLSPRQRCMVTQPPSLRACSLPRSRCSWAELISPRRSVDDGFERVSACTVANPVIFGQPALGDQKTRSASKTGSSGGPY